jgi:hypothetical protein
VCRAAADAALAYLASPRPLTRAPAALAAAARRGWRRAAAWLSGRAWLEVRLRAPARLREVRVIWGGPRPPGECVLLVRAEGAPGWRTVLDAGGGGGAPSGRSSPPRGRSSPPRGEGHAGPAVSAAALGGAAVAAVRLEVAVAGALQEGHSVSVLEVQLWGEDEATAEGQDLST